MRTAQVETQLSAFAASAARANRPTSVLLLPGLLTLCAAIFALWAWSGLAAARRTVSFQQAALQRIAGYVGQIRVEETTGTDLATLFGPLPYISSQIIEAHQGIQFREQPAVGTAVSAVAVTNPPIDRLDVNCTVQSEPLEKTLAWIDNVQRAQFLAGRVFVSQLQVSPNGTGWRSQIRFSAYARK